MALPAVFAEQTGSQFISDMRKPAPPRRLKVFVTIPGQVTVEWQDVGIPGGILIVGRTIPVHYWRVYVCPAKNANANPTGVDIIHRASRFSQLDSTGTGEIMDVFLAFPDLGDYWFVVAGVSEVGVIGLPSQPVLIDTSHGTVAGLNNIVTLPIGPIISVDQDDIYGNHFIRIQPGWLAPNVLGSFFGVQLEAVGAYGHTDLMELGNVMVYPYQTGGQFIRGDIILPVDEGAWTGTAHFTAGSKTVTRVSGDNFNTFGDWNGKTIRALNDGGSPPLYVIDNVTNSSTLLLTVNYGGSTGDHTVRIYNPVTYYFANVDRDGNRPADVIGTCPSASSNIGIRDTA